MLLLSLSSLSDVLVGEVGMDGLTLLPSIWVILPHDVKCIFRLLYRGTETFETSFIVLHSSLFNFAPLWIQKSLYFTY